MFYNLCTFSCLIFHDTKTTLNSSATPILMIVHSYRLAPDIWDTLSNKIDWQHIFVALFLCNSIKYWYLCKEQGRTIYPQGGTSHGPSRVPWPQTSPGYLVIVKDNKRQGRTFLPTGENLAWSFPTPLTANISRCISCPGRSLAMRMSSSTGPTSILLNISVWLPMGIHFICLLYTGIIS